MLSGGRHNRRREPNAKGKNLVVVESSSKVNTLHNILSDSSVATAFNPLRDLPGIDMGIDVDRGFQPTYVSPDDMGSSLEQIVRMGNEANKIFIATEPDREGEAIACHVMEVTGSRRRSIPPKRVVSHEVTKEAVEDAFKSPLEIDMQLVNAQQATSTRKQSICKP